MSARHTLAIPAEVQEVLRGSRIESDRVFLPGQLDRKLYTSTMKVLTEYGGKWNRSAGAILIKAGDREKLVEALGTGVVKREKVIRQAFYTPEDVADDLVAFVGDALPGYLKSDGMLVLEPSAGGGALVRGVKHRWPNAGFVCVEIDEQAANELTKHGITTHCADFLKFTPDRLGKYHLVIMNPPYQRGQALKHVTHALEFVADGGVLGAIVPQNFPETFDGWRIDTQDVPAGAFKESGTSIATKMIRAARA